MSRGVRVTRYLVVGASSAALDLLLLVVLRELAGWPVVLATSTAFWVALVFNFTLNRSWSFQTTDVGAPLLRYLALVGVNYVLTVALVTGGVALGVPYLVAKLAAIGLVACGTYLAYERWVFA